MKKILVATDLSSRSDRAVLRAIKMAKEYKAHLTILNIIDEDTPKSLLEENKKIVMKEINLFIKGKTKDLKFDVVINVGIPHLSILDFIGREQIDLVVLGTHRHTKGESMIGNVIERVIKSSMKPVLVVVDRPENNYSNILAAVDFNVHSKKSLKLAFDFFKDSKFTLLHSYYMPFTGITGVSNLSLEQELKDNISGDIDELVREVYKGKKQQNIVKKIVKGSVFEVIKEEMIHLKPELLVLGTHGRSGIAKAFSLNITENILLDPNCDTLVVL
jgi:universal stress protein E